MLQGLVHSDVILAVGARFDDRVTNTVSKFCPGAKIIHIDVDPASIAKIVPVDLPIVGPVTTVLKDLDAQIDQHIAASDRVIPDVEAIAEWWAQIDSWRAAHGLWHGRTLIKVMILTHYKWRSLPFCGAIESSAYPTPSELESSRMNSMTALAGSCAPGLKQ